ncbi:hypothetical protein [Planomonospora sp. ID82291]|uniref:hypothetical protein n=1 Tax=Planomonospora sp. ID82291 TaxID=2738136 RepID=UPI0018C3A865|nr:hypothetical protein [Planomonospora sp. ID82291]MBG0819128.1 hypothetical protein [Planomonospora sp. ID82291]
MNDHLEPEEHAGESAFSETLNFKITKRMKARIVQQTKRLDLTQTATTRLALSLGLEALEAMTAVAEDVGSTN